MFCYSCFFLEIFSTLALPQLSFSHEYSYRLGCLCHVCGNSLVEMFHQKTIAKKAPKIGWFQVEVLNISDIFYKIQNFN